MAPGPPSRMLELAKAMTHFRCMARSIHSLSLPFKTGSVFRFQSPTVNDLDAPDIRTNSILDEDSETSRRLRLLEAREVEHLLDRVLTYLSASPL